MYEAICRECGTPATRDGGFLPEQRVACNACGSIERKYPQLAKSYNGEVGVVVKAKSEDRRKAKPLLHETSGASHSTQLGRWLWRNVEIDRVRNYYREIVLDPESGVVLHYCEEPLSSHRSRGSAKLRDTPSS